MEERLRLLNEIISIMVPDIGEIVNEIGNNNFEVQKFRGITAINPILKEVLHMTPIVATYAKHSLDYNEDDLYNAWCTSCNVETFTDLLEEIVISGEYNKFLKFVYVRSVIEHFKNYIMRLKNIEFDVELATFQYIDYNIEDDVTVNIIEIDQQRVRFMIV